MIKDNFDKEKTSLVMEEKTDSHEELIRSIELSTQGSIFTFLKSPKRRALDLAVLGKAYYESEAGERFDNLNKALKLFKQSSLLLTIQRKSLFENICTQKYLGLIFCEYPYEDNLEKAIQHFRTCVTYLEPNNKFTSDKFKLLEKKDVDPNYEYFQPTADNLKREWTKIRNHLGKAYYLKFQQIQKEENNNLQKQSQLLELAIETFRNSLNINIEEEFSQEWATAYRWTGQSYYYRIERDRSENIEQAISAYQQSLTVFTLEQFPKEWAFTQSLLGIAYYHRLQPDRFQENLKLAIAAFRQALTVLNFQNYPAEWLATQNNLGIVYLNYLDGDRTTNLELAREAFESIEKVLVEDLEKYPNNSAELLLTRYHLAIVYRELEQVKPTENLKRSLQAIDVILSSLKLELPTDWLQ